MKLLVTVYHTHNHGMDTYIGFVKKKYVKFATYGTLIETFNIDYDPDRNNEGPEYLDWQITKPKDIITIFERINNE
jgi:hypothetical protein